MPLAWKRQGVEATQQDPSLGRKVRDGQRPASPFQTRTSTREAVCTQRRANLGMPSHAVLRCGRNMERPCAAAGRTCVSESRHMRRRTTYTFSSAAIMSCTDGVRLGPTARPGSGPLTPARAAPIEQPGAPAHTPTRPAPTRQARSALPRPRGARRPPGGPAGGRAGGARGARRG